jgi:hypothetical protein
MNALAQLGGPSRPRLRHPVETKSKFAAGWQPARNIAPLITSSVLKSEGNTRLQISATFSRRQFIGSVPFTGSDADPQDVATLLENLAAFIRRGGQ